MTVRTALHKRAFRRDDRPSRNPTEMLRKILLPLTTCLVIAAASSAASQAQSTQPALVVVISVDQLRYDYLERFRKNLTEDGLVSAVRRRGLWYTNCKHQHAFTYTGPGHAVLLTSTYPNRNGIIGNNWYDRTLQKLRYCVDDPNSRLIGAETKDSAVSPALLIGDTVGDQMKLASNGRSKVYTISIKDRAAILMAGRTADAAIWMSNEGDWITSVHYARTLPESIEKLNASAATKRFAKRVWQPLYAPNRYVHGPTENSDEERPRYGMTADFPHVLPAADDVNYIRNLVCMPFGNEVTLAAARTLIVEEQLGRDEDPDLLAINFSANDYVGHSFGPDSLEAEDLTYRTDLLLGEFVRFLERQIGPRRFVLFVTGDHGAAPIPELVARRGMVAARNPLGTVASGTGNIPEMETPLEAFLAEQLNAAPATEDDPTGMVLAFTENAVYLNRDHPAVQGRGFDLACRLTRDWVLQQPTVVCAMTRNELLKPAESGTEIQQLMKRSFHPTRSGDVLYVLKPYHFHNTAATTHGTPWHYDRHVPLLVLGTVPQGQYSHEVSPASIGTTIAEMLHVEFPSMAEAPPLAEVPFPAPSTAGAERH